MTAAHDLLADLDLIGARLEPAGDRLILRAGSKAIPAALVRRVREAKADLLATLAVRMDDTVIRSDGDRENGGNSSPHEGKHRTFESCVIEWLTQHPTPSAPGRCAWCGMPESPGAVVLPFGTEPGTHTWLHSECWPAWQKVRRADAVAALRATDPTFNEAPSNDHGIKCFGAAPERVEGERS
jgi:hypothetical protein